jgi:hypothetical protein
MAEPPRRVVITSARRSASRPRRQVVTQEIDEQTAVGDVYMRSLIRTQLRLAVTVLVVLAVTIGSVPLLFAVVPNSRTTHVFGLPLPWVLLGVLVYPALIALGWFYVHQAERNERDFTELVERE